MSKVALLGTTVLRTATIVSLAAATPVFAQQVPTTDQSQDQAQDPAAIPSTQNTQVNQTSPNSDDAATSPNDSEVVVTGSASR